jgi:hypothetical protein
VRVVEVNEITSAEVDVPLDSNITVTNYRPQEAAGEFLARIRRLAPGRDACALSQREDQGST